MLRVQQVLALLVAMAGMLLMVTVVQGGGQPPPALAGVAPYSPHLMGVGVVWYVVVRLLLLVRDRR